MTDITPRIARDAQVIGAYGPGFVKISGKIYTAPVVVQGSRVDMWSGVIDDLSPIENIELILLGMPGVPRPLDPQMRARFKAQGKAIEVMDIGAACRTFNVLMAEGRQVAAALQLVIVANSA